MDRRKLGRTGLEIAPLVFGGNVFGWTADEATSFALLDAFTDAGFNAVDTADAYSRWVPGHSGGESETIIGKWLKRHGGRDKVLILTKVGSEMGPGKKGLSKAYIRQAVEASLKRLQTDYIDLYQSHWPDPETPIEETLEAHEELVKQGKVRAVGGSNYDAAGLAAALKAGDGKTRARYQTLQPEYNLYDRAGYEKDLEPLCRKEGLGVITYFSLASGFLTGKYRSEADLGKSPRGEDIGKYLDARGKKILAALDALAKRYSATPAQIALAWLMARPSVTAPIASATSLAQLKDIVKAAEIKLDRDAIAALDATG
ncbi:MAG TPA: aldo/keto reductase [Hypericibacter adhaerens]|uniref:aldo/keto reductase n=1 Tax=Hypericibacter adhaerens TaxID=2602016 RepID=UPI0012475195|nr:aldo/keto reductase [Hypericibacter adhaerens]HWA43892.1 aldo/keto reductase [Hypericibacter adhaerens]